MANSQVLSVTQIMGVDGNIHLLMAQLSVPQVRAYLLKRGWSDANRDDPERLYFLGPIHEGGQPYQISIPTSAHWQRLRGRLQNALFALSGIEDRQPLEIARDMLMEAAASMPSPIEDGAATRIRIRNGGSELTILRLSNETAKIRLAPGRSVSVLFQSPCHPEIVINGPEVRIQVPGGIEAEFEVE